MSRNARTTREEKVHVRLKAFHENIAAIIDCYTQPRIGLRERRQYLKIFSILKMFVGVYVSKSAGFFFWSRAFFKGTFEVPVQRKATVALPGAPCEAPMIIIEGALPRERGRSSSASSRARTPFD